MNKLQVVRRAATCALMAVGLFCGAAASYAYTTPPVAFYIHVPYGPKGQDGHNKVSFSLTSYDTKTMAATVTIIGSETKKYTVSLGVPTPVSNKGGGKGEGAVSGELREINIGAVIVVTFSGKMTGLWSQDVQPYVEVKADAPLLVGVTDGK